MRRFYRVAVPPEEEVDAFKALVEFYTAGPQEVADRPGSSRTEELALTTSPTAPPSWPRSSRLTASTSPGQGSTGGGSRPPHVEPARGDPAGEDHRVPDC